MLRTFFSTCLTAALVCGNTVSADEAYVLKLYKSKQGDKTTTEKTDENKTKVLVVVNGMEHKEDLVNGTKAAFTEEILQMNAGARRATKLTRAYTTAERIEKGETVKAAYAGQTVLIEKKDNKYEFSIKGKALEKSEAPELFKQFDKPEDAPRNEDFLPSEEVKVGGSWKVAAEKSEKMFEAFPKENMKVDAKKSSISGKLLKAYKKEGVQFGTLEITIELLLTDVDVGGQFVKAKEGSRVTLTITLDACIDGSLPFIDAKMQGTMDIVAELPVGELTLKSTMTGGEKIRAAK
jgi:hypothetical protein